MKENTVVISLKRLKELEEYEYSYDIAVNERIRKEVKPRDEEILELQNALKRDFVCICTQSSWLLEYPKKDYFVNKQSINGLPFLKRLVAKWVFNNK